MDRLTYAMRTIDDPRAVSIACRATNDELTKQANGILKNMTIHNVSNKFQKLEILVHSICFGAMAFLYEYDIIPAAYIMRMAKTMDKHHAATMYYLGKRQYKSLLEHYAADMKTCKNINYLAEVYHNCISIDMDGKTYVDAKALNKYLKSQTPFTKRFPIKYLPKDDKAATNNLYKLAQKIIQETGDEYLEEDGPVYYTMSESEKQLRDIGIEDDFLHMLVSCLEIPYEAVRAYSITTDDGIKTRVARLNRLLAMQAPRVIIWNEYNTLAKRSIYSKILISMLDDIKEKKDVIGDIYPILEQYAEASKDTKNIETIKKAAEGAVKMYTGKTLDEWRKIAGEYVEEEFK